MSKKPTRPATERVTIPATGPQKKAWAKAAKAAGVPLATWCREQLDASLDAATRATLPAVQPYGWQPGRKRSGG